MAETLTFSEIPDVQERLSDVEVEARFQQLIAAGAGQMGVAEVVDLYEITAGPDEEEEIEQGQQSDKEDGTGPYER